MAAVAISLAFAIGVRAADTPPDAVNLAVVATPSTSFVSGHETLTAINDGFDPKDSGDTQHGEYGNWPQSGTQWVQLEWPQPISTKEVKVYWWNDYRGVRIPKACRLSYWDGNAFVPVANAKGLGLAEHQYNVTQFDEVTTTKLRLEMDSDETFSTGILEWQVLDSGKSPTFPPIVIAGSDRVVVCGGKTYLNGRVQSLARGGIKAPATWSKRSGPGAVTFEDATATETTAIFTEPGEYVLALTAGTPPQTAQAELKVRVADMPPTPRARAAGSWTVHTAELRSGTRVPKH